MVTDRAEAGSPLVGRKRIWRVYALALSVLVAVIAGSHLLSDRMAAGQEDDARIINLAGKQRALSQKIAGRIAEAAQRDRVRIGFIGALYDDVNLMAVNHARLTGRTADQVDQTLSQEIRRLYFEGEPSVDDRVLGFLERSRGMIRAIEEGRAINERALAHYLGQARGRVLADLDRVVAQYEADANARLAQLRLLNVLLFGVSIAIILLELTFVFRPLARRLEAAQRALLDLARTDPLTGCWNRRAFMETGEVLRRVEGRAGKPLAVMLCDIDHFKAVNDTHGHPAGDAVIRDFAARCLATLRGQDVLGRYGGEEFVALLPDATEAQAASVAERIRAAVASGPVETPDTAIPITASFGVAGVGEGDDSLHAAIERADQALYQAKAEGRNRVRVRTA